MPGASNAATPYRRVSGTARGFTLIEMLVVVSLIAVLVTLVMIRTDRDLDRIAELEATRFKALIEYARDESILLGRPYAVEVDAAARRYRFLVPGETWQPVKKDEVLRERHLPDGITMSIDTTGTGGRDPLVIVDGLGAISPFNLTIHGTYRDYIVTVDAGQTLKVSQQASG